MSFSIRPATEKDIETLLVFEQEIVNAERPFDPTIKTGKPHYYDLKKIIASATAKVLVAEIEREIVGSGYAIIKKAQDFLSHTEFAYLGFMYVKPSQRGKGINQAIVASLTQWAASRNISEIRLDVYDQNIAAKKAYEKVGFKPHMLEMRLDIRP